MLAAIRLVLVCEVKTFLFGEEISIAEGFVYE